MQFLPLIFLGLIIFFSATAARARRQEAARRAEQVRAEQETVGKPAPRPVPVKAPSVKTEKPAITPAAKKKTESMTSYAERLSSAKKQPAAEEKRESPKTAGPSIPSLKWNQNTAMQGIVYAEILGKPKALRRK